MTRQKGGGRIPGKSPGPPPPSPAKSIGISHDTSLYVSDTRVPAREALLYHLILTPFALAFVVACCVLLTLAWPS